MHIKASSVLEEAGSALAVVAGLLGALAVRVHLSTAAPYVLLGSALWLVLLQWKRRAGHRNMLLRLFGFCFTFMLLVLVVQPWVVSLVGTA